MPSISALFGWYPYLCLTVFLLGSLIRFDREQYTWRSGSSPAAAAQAAACGAPTSSMSAFSSSSSAISSGLLTPIAVFDALGITHGFKQLHGDRASAASPASPASSASRCSLHRRLFDPRIRDTSIFGDIAILLLLWAQLTLGLLTISVSLGHLDGHEMVKFMIWAQGILTLQPGAGRCVADVNPIFKLHLVARHDDLPRLPLHPAGACVERAGLVSRPARLSGRAHAAAGAGSRQRQRSFGTAWSPATEPGPACPPHAGGVSDDLRCSHPPDAA